MVARFQLGFGEGKWTGCCPGWKPALRAVCRATKNTASSLGGTGSWSYICVSATYLYDFRQVT